MGKQWVLCLDTKSTIYKRRKMYNIKIIFKNLYNKEGDSEVRGHMNAYGKFMLTYGKGHHSIVKELFSN